MKKSNCHIKGFTFIEMVITLIITSIGTGTMMYVFNAAQTRYFNDQMETSIDTYCNSATDFIATIVSRSDSTIKQTSDIPRRYTIYKFNDKYINQDSDQIIEHQRVITIELTDKGGVIIKERNKDITAELYNKYMLRDHKKDGKGHYLAGNREWNAMALQGSFNPGNKFQDGDQNLPTQYTLVQKGFKIVQMDPGDRIGEDFFPYVRGINASPIQKCTYNIEILLEIQNKFDDNSTSNQFYTYKTYTKRAYCPSCFMRES